MGGGFRIHFASFQRRGILRLKWSVSDRLHYYAAKIEAVEFCLKDQSGEISDAAKLNVPIYDFYEKAQLIKHLSVLQESESLMNKCLRLLGKAGYVAFLE